MRAVDVQELVGRDVSTWRELRAAGATRSQITRAVAAGRVVRVLPGVYAAQPLPAWPVHLVRDERPVPEHVLHVRAVLLALGPRACAAGVTAAAVRGWGLLHEPVGTVHALVPHGRTRVELPRASVRRARRLAVEVVRPCADVGPLQVQPALDTVLEGLGRLPLLDAVVLLDSALRSGAVQLDEVCGAAASLRGGPAGRARQALRLCDTDAGSVLESAARVRMLLAGIPGFETQVVVRDANGRHLLRSDFCFAAARLLVEVDGSRFHEARRDQAVDNALVAAGWRVLRFSWAEVVHDPDRFVALVEAALAA